MGQPNQQKLANMMMNNIVKLGQFSYELEEKREQSIITQSGQMLTAFSVFSAALFMLLPIVLDINDLLNKKILFVAGVVSGLLLASLVLALIAQWRFKYNTMEPIDVFFNRVNEEHQNYVTQAQFDIQWKEQLIQIHKSKKANNDKRVMLIIASMILFLCAVGFVVIAAFFLILINL